MAALMKRRTAFASGMFVCMLAMSGVAAPVQDAPNLPYVAVHNPEFISIAAATFMSGDDRVIGVATGNAPKAYPAGILAQHGLVEDDSPDGPIAITW